MAHIDQVISLLYAVYKEMDMEINDGKVWVREKLKRSWSKLCTEAKEIIEEKYLSAQKILE